MKSIADSGLLIAFLDARDEHHDWALGWLRELPAPLFTCEAVLTEVAQMTGRGDILIALVERGDIAILFDLQEQAAVVHRLMLAYQNLPMDLADACLVRMTELIPDCMVYTTDRRDFTVYRRFGREPIPFLAPP